MRGQVKVTVTYLVESDTKYYDDKNYFSLCVSDSSEMRLVKGVQQDFTDAEGPLEELCVTGGMHIDSSEFVKWL